MSNMLANQVVVVTAGRIGDANDIAQAAVFLMTSPHTTGTVLHVEGGLLLA